MRRDILNTLRIHAVAIRSFPNKNRGIILNGAVDDEHQTWHNRATDSSPHP